VSALLLAAVLGTRVEASIALAAHELVAVVLPGKHHERWLNDATSQTKHQVEGRLLLDVVVGKSTAVLKLLAGEDEALLVRRNTFLVLNLLLHILDSVRRLHLEGDGLSRQCLDEDLHLLVRSVADRRET